MTTKKENEIARRKILIGNSFPLSLIRKGEVRMTCPPVSELRAALRDSDISSYWGHENTRKVAEAVAGASLAPRSERPALGISADGRPVLYGEEFGECWVLSPDYIPGFRPSIGQEVGEESITGWAVVKMEWL